jgi:hypothetical protein
VDPDAALEALYGAAPEAFVPTRTRLVAELRAAGAAEAAASLQRLRRPTLAAWAVNQAARRKPEALAELFAATHDLAVAQRDTLAGTAGSEELRTATRRRHDLLTALADAAISALAGHAPKPATHRDAIIDTFDAATLDPDAAEALRAGRITQPLVAPATFGPLDAPALPGMPPSRPARRPSARQIAKAERDREIARRNAERAARAAETAESEVVSADLATESALSHLQEVDRARDRARDELSSASSRLTAAQRAAITARTALDETIRAVAAREAALADVRGE